MKYFTKLADVYYFGPKARGNKDARITSGGLFIGAGQDDDYICRRRVFDRVLDKLSKRGGGSTFWDIKNEYLKHYPDDFVSVVTKVEAPPRFGYLRKKRFIERSENPAGFHRMGPRHSYFQQALHREVVREKVDKGDVTPKWNKKRIKVV